MTIDPRIRRVPLPNGTRYLAIERLKTAWIVWINADIEYKRGTYIQIDDSGSISRVTLYEDGTVHVSEVF
jgi:hypothetical protein